MFVDSHCHLDFPELRASLPEVLDAMHANAVTHALVVAVDMPGWPSVHGIARAHPNLYASVGVHPDYEETQEPTRELLAARAMEPRIVAIGETGLDYYRITGDLEWQRARFRTHIRAARDCGRPLIVHTRSAAEDTLRILREEGAAEVGGVMHCFTETWDVASAAMDLGFFISFSGIVTFRNAAALQDVARRIPLERMLVETDSPYLAPVPYRGKRNQPAYVRHVAEHIAQLREDPLEVIAGATTRNFFDLFKIEASPAQ
jgi:TatD DNase family protein